MFGKYFRTQSECIYSFIEDKEIVTHSIHDTRIAIKRVMALLQLISYCDTDFKEKSAVRPYRNLFRKLGTVREFEVAQKWFSRLRIPSSGWKIRHIELQGASAAAQLKCTLTKSRYRTIKKQEKKISHALDTLKSKHLKKYVTQLEQEITERLFSTNLSPSTFHDLRKLIKVFMYNQQALPQKLKSELNVFDAFDQLQSLIGDWHDLEQIIEEWSVYAIAANDTNSHSAYKHILKKQQGLQNEILKHIAALKIKLEF